jgi:hypothetical protein
MCKPDDSGSLFFNYQNFFSTVLMYSVDPDYCFISIDVLMVHLVTAIPIIIWNFVKNYEKIA